MTSLLLLLVNAVAPVSAASGAQPPPVVDEPGVSGYVLAPDGTPVSGGTVVAQSGIDIFTLTSFLIVVMIMLAVLGALRNPPGD